MWRILWHYWQTKYGRRFPSREALETWQHQRVIQFLQWVLPRSPFYQDLYAGLAPQDWRQFPVVDKAIMMAHFDRLNTIGITKTDAMAIARQAEESRDFQPTWKQYTVGISSGTSGNRGIFLVSPAEQQAWAGTILAKALPQSILVRQRIALFLRANSNLYTTVGRRRIQFQYFDLFASVESHLQRLNDYAPTILVAPPSMLRVLATAQLSGELTIKPHQIISVAEVLDPLDEAFISDTFQQPIHQLYQCTEGFLAATCSHGTLHLNEDTLVIQKEYIDQASGRFMPIITDFNRTSQPIIRYRLDDILTEQKTPCPCGSTLTAIAHVEGRCDDIFYLRDRAHSRLIPIFPDMLRRTIILASEAIQEYAVVQTPDQINVYLQVPETEWETTISKVESALKERLETFGCQVPPLQFSHYQANTQYDKKLRRIRREASVPES